MEATDVKGDRLTVSAGGSGDLKLSGKAVVKHLGLGTATVHASDLLDVSVTGIGTVEYLGSPTLRRNVLGVGTVRPKR
jgi:hypothetical protein